MSNSSSLRTRKGRLNDCLCKLQRLQDSLPDRCGGNLLLQNAIQSLENEDAEHADRELTALLACSGKYSYERKRIVELVLIELRSIPKPNRWSVVLRTACQKMCAWILYQLCKAQMKQWFPLIYRLSSSAPMHQPLQNLTPSSLAHLLCCREPNLWELAEKAPRLYRISHIEKSNGGVRTIEAPAAELKKVQRALLDKVFTKIRTDPCFYGVKGTRMVDAVRLHCEKPMVMTLDIQNFFPSVTIREVRHALSTRGAEPELVDLIARLTTYKWRLPQGAPTSPFLAAMALQPYIRRVKDALGALPDTDICVYVDDIAISGPDGIVATLNPIRAVFERSPFTLHSGKTKIMRSGSTQVVLGVEIHGKQLKPTPEFCTKLTDRIQSHGKAHPVVRGMLAFQRSLRQSA